MHTLKQKVIARIDELQDRLWAISCSLYEKPEIAFQEFEACRLLTGELESGGFEVENPLGELQTAFRGAALGSGPGSVVAFMAEYDALPGLGHACGHNLIAAAAVGAGLGVQAVMGQIQGRVEVIGSPAEECGGGKRILVDAGIFSNVDAALMFHPATKTMVERGSLASVGASFEFFGRASHAAAAPDQGINALDACILTFNNINALRQHLNSRDRIAGIITHGGEAANVVPAYAAAKFNIRGKSEKRRDYLVEKVIACAQAAAQATGCRFKYDLRPGYAEIIPNKVIGRLMAQNLAHLGRPVSAPEPDERMGSTDMGNVSQVVPAIHAYLATVPASVVNHTNEFREACMAPAGRAAMLDAARALAMTAVDLLAEPEWVVQARCELEETLHQT